MALTFQKHVPGFGKALAPTFAEKIWTDQPTSEDIDTILSNLEKGKLKEKLREYVRVVADEQPPPPHRESPIRPHQQVRRPLPPAPRPLTEAAAPAPLSYGPLRNSRLCAPAPYRQPQQDPTWKTRSCRYFEAGACQKYHFCKYAHGDDDFRFRYCPYFLAGDASSCPERWTGRCQLYHDTK